MRKSFLLCFDRPGEKKTAKGDTTNLLSTLLAVKANKVSCLVNVGRLLEFAPALAGLQLQSGWSEFWNEMRKVAKAVTKQESWQASYAALFALRVRLRADAGQDWLRLLTSGNQQEQEVTRRYFLEGQ